MKNIILIAALAMSMVGCKMLDAVDSVNATPAKMDDMNNQIKKTNNAVHKQTLLVAINEMSKPENQAKLFPVPTAMMPAGKAFAEEATREELVLLTYDWIKEIEEVTDLKKIDAAGNEVEYTIEEKNQMRREKTAKLYAMFIIAGFTPDEVVADIINTEILGNGRFQETGLQFLMMRTLFIRDVMLQASLLAKPLKTSGMMNEAVKYLQKLEVILRLPFVKEVSLNVVDKELKLLEVSESLGSADSFASTVGMWQKALDRAVDGNQTLQQKDWTGNTAENDRLYRAELAAQAKAINVLKANADAWQKKLTQP